MERKGLISRFFFRNENIQRKETATEATDAASVDFWPTMRDAPSMTW